MDYMERLRIDTSYLREELLAHPVYGLVDNIDSLRVFMEHHVFAVWDFMSLLKRLQQLETSVEVPWLPKPRRTTARLINEIVLGEESDEDGSGGYSSHYELYRVAMVECAASTRKIDCLTATLVHGASIEEALNASGAEPTIAAFVRTTWRFIASRDPWVVAAAFTFGREDIIPDMFRRCIASLAPTDSCSLTVLKHYLARHIDVDEESHAPMARQMMHELCGEDPYRWQAATEAVMIALRARIQLWDGVVSELADVRKIHLPQAAARA